MKKVASFLTGDKTNGRSKMISKVEGTGSTKQVGSTTSPLAAALGLKDKFIKLLHQMSQPFLTPLTTSVLSKFATAYYANEKH
jgi:hypothetical protein